VLEFLDLKDEYSETDLEDALIRHLQSFLLELGDDFTVVGRLRIDDEWFRIDLLRRSVPPPLPARPAPAAVPR
jgi:predicted nuclease of restriction endonuclease-like (RecB) superfamily